MLQGQSRDNYTRKKIDRFSPEFEPTIPIISNTMKNHSFVILAALFCLSALPSYAQADPSSVEQTVNPPIIEIPEVTAQSEATIDERQTASDPDKCPSVER